MTTPRVAFVAVFHETNTFSSGETGRDGFAARWYRGGQLHDAFASTKTVGGGFLDGAAEAGMTVVPVFGAFATPSGPVTRPAFDDILAEIEQGLTDLEVDGILLELHGDLFVSGSEDAEAEIVSLVSRLQPGRPIAAVTDLHANVSVPRLTELAILVGYRTNPHVDTWATGRRAALLLADVIAGRLAPVREHAGLPIVAAPSVQQTADEPLRSLIALADELEADPRLVDVTVHAGYAYGDSASTGMGFSATADAAHRAAARDAVDRLKALAARTASVFRTSFPSAADAILEAVTAPGLVAIADTGDNINGGSPGDTTWLSHLAIRHPERRFLTTIADPAAVQIARTAGVGARVSLSLGGHASTTSGEPITGEAEVLAITDGVFRNEGPMATGNRIDMHGAAVVRIANLTVLIQGSATQPNDSAMFRSAGIDLNDVDVVLLKGAAAIRADWSPRVSRIIDAGTLGETDQVLSRLDYRRAALLPAPAVLVEHQDVAGAPAMFPSAARIGERIIVVWSDTPDGWPGGRALGSWSDDDGRTWSAPVVVATPAPGEASVVSALSLTPRADGTVRFAYNGVTWPTPNAADRIATVSFTDSTDGERWSDPITLQSPYAFPAVYGEIVPVPGGEIMPIWGRRSSDEHWRAGVWFAEDGTTWQEHGNVGWAPVAALDEHYVDDGSQNVDDDIAEQISQPRFRPHDATGGFNETSIQRVSDGALRAIVRQQGVAGASDPLMLFTTASGDDGRTWSAPTELGFTGMSPCLRVLPDGRLLLAYRRTVPTVADTAAVEVRIGSPDAARWSLPLPLPTGSDEPLPYEYQVGYPSIVTSVTSGEHLVLHYSYRDGEGRLLRLARIRVPELG
ncbi:hypothetical protein ASD65_10340 [Microbacterium sp. Root61]|uniref:M81 family metallopeptidase n=1 Tax=Microbacterium sp. Root61 TaxID=1736570 RepID=UPI0006F92828|nr:M81 family metallopeptidase [Microbacterium sp. Root61]KRA24776.1 hypothetical protein ASD65_10340 [Microbacterium sp. Root61]